MATELAGIVGRNIRLARREQGRYNQREFAEEIRNRDPRLATSNQRASDWERGVQKPSDRHMKLVAEVLEKPVAWFYEEHGDLEEGAPDLFARDEPDPEALARIEFKQDVILGILEQQVGAAVLAAVREELGRARRTVP